MGHHSLPSDLVSDRDHVSLNCSNTNLLCPEAVRKEKSKDGSIRITSLHIFCVLKQSGMIKNKARLIHIAWLHISWFFKVSGIISMAQIVLPHQTSLGPEGDQGQSGTTIFQSECHHAHYLVTHLLDLKVVRDRYQ